MTNDFPKPPGQLWQERRRRSSKAVRKGGPVPERRQISFRLSLETEQKIQCLIESLELVTTAQNPITGEFVVSRTKYSRASLCRALVEKAIEDLHRETFQ